jgi:hypothetical protein
LKNEKVIKTKKKKESGCTKPLYGKKAKCLLRIVPQEEKEKPFHVDSQCIIGNQGSPMTPPFIEEKVKNTSKTK